MLEKVNLVEISFVEKRKFKLPEIKKGRDFYLFLLSFLSLLAIPIFYYAQSKILNDYQNKLSQLDRNIRLKTLQVKRLKTQLKREQRIFENLYVADIKEKYFVSRIYKYFNRAIYADFTDFLTSFKDNFYKAFVVFPNPLKLNNRLLLPYETPKGRFLENINPLTSNLNISTAIALYVKTPNRNLNIKELNLIQDKKLKSNLKFQLLLLKKKQLDLLLPVTLIYPVGFFYKNTAEKKMIIDKLKRNCNYFIKEDYFEYNYLLGKLFTKGFLQGFCVRTKWYKVRDKVW
jgi:hypothetical protein